MTTRTDDELNAIYVDANGTNHAAALRALYQTGRADEAAIAKDQIDHLTTRHENAVAGVKRAIKDPGDPAPAAGASPSTVTAYSDTGEVQKPAPLVNAAPGAPAAGQNPPGEHPPSAA